MKDDIYVPPVPKSIEALWRFRLCKSYKWTRACLAGFGQELTTIGMYVMSWKKHTLNTYSVICFKDLAGIEFSSRERTWNSDFNLILRKWKSVLLVSRGIVSWDKGMGWAASLLNFSCLCKSKGKDRNIMIPSVNVKCKVPGIIKHDAIGVWR